MDSNISGVSAQSAPTYNNYHYSQQQPPPSAMASYNDNKYQPRHRPLMSRMEGAAPVTGQPEVVGDISDYQHRKQQEEQKQNNSVYPSLQPIHPKQPSEDGYHGTGAGYVPALSQSRTSGTGQQLSGIDQSQPGPQGNQYSVGRNNQDQSNRLHSAADEPQTIIPSSISAYNPNMPAPTVPEESSSDDDDLNDLMSGNVLKKAAGSDEKESDSEDDERTKQRMQTMLMKPIQPAPSADDDEEDEDEDNQAADNKEKKLEAVQEDAEEDVKQAVAAKQEEAKEEEKAAKEEEEEESDDDGGLSEWLQSIGFKKKKLEVMVTALSELGLDSMEDLETLLIDLYKNSYGNQQKQWMDKIQQDILGQGIKYAQWIRFSTKAQAMIEMKVKQQQQGGVAANGDENNLLLHAADNQGGDEKNKGRKKTTRVTQGADFGLVGNAAANAGLGNNNGFIVMQSEEAQQMENLRNAMAAIYSGIENLDNLVLTVEKNEKTAVEAVEREFGRLLKEIENRKGLLIASITGVGEDKSGILGKQNTELRSIAAEYEETLVEFNRILAENQNIRSKSDISKRQQRLSNLVFTALNRHKQVNMTPMCTPLIGFHCNITPIVLELNNLGVVTWGNAPKPPRFTKVQTTDWSIMVEYDVKDKKSKQQNQHVAQDPIIAYEVQCVLCKNEENLLWNFQHELRKQQKEKSSEKDKKHKKKYGVIDHGVITKHVTSKQIVLVGFVAESKDYVLRVRCQNRNGWSEYSQCILCKTKKKKKRKAKLVHEKLKVIRHRGSTQDGSPNNLLFSNEKLVYQSLSNQDFINELTNYKKVNKNNRNKEFTDWLIFDLGAFIELITFRIKFEMHYRWGNVPKLVYIDIADYDDHSYSSSIIHKYKPISYDDDYHNPDDPNAMSGVLVQLRRKRLEAEQQFESIWNRIAIIECKKKSGWQDFNLFESIDESKRKGQYIRIQFVNNFDCNIEHYAKFVVEQIAFVGISYDD